MLNSRVRHRALALMLVVALAALFGGVGYYRLVKRPALAPEVAREFAAGQAFADSLAARLERAPSASDVRMQDAVAAVYLERQRLGLGSPFRLIEYALGDPLLPDSAARVRVAYALLARTVVGQGYQVDAETMDLVGPSGLEQGAVGAAHLALIDSVMRTARDPRGAEMTIRLAYRLASSAGTVGRRGSTLGTFAAAMARDRALAARDAGTLLRAATDQHVDPLSLVAPWREARTFAVERPVLDSLPASVERAALAAVRPTLASIGALDSLARLAVIARADSIRADSAAADLVRSDSARGVPARGAPTRGAGTARDVARADSARASAKPAPALARYPRGARRVVPEPVARRIADLVARRVAPPEAPVAVAVDAYRRLIESEADSAAPRARGARFIGAAKNEESLAAEYLLLESHDDTPRSGPALAVLWAAVSLRAYGQEAVWFPGDPGPTAAALQDRFGLRAVTFDARVPSRWRPYYLRMLASALTDLQSVMPALGLRGLAVHFGADPLAGAVLALHDPSSRTVLLPAPTSAGAIAHEIAHDLDWQMARRRFGTRASYGTDRAVKATGDRFAASVHEMTRAALNAPGVSATPQASNGQRPTEVFARNVDWFVSAALAREGRMNGYLTAVQDGVLTGYAALVSPEAARDGGDAMMRVLEEMTVVPATTRSWFLGAFGGTRPPSAYTIVSRVLDTPITYRELRRPRAWPFGVAPLDARPGAADLATQPLQIESCDIAGTVRDPGLSAERRRLAVLAAEARADGVLRRRRQYSEGSATAPTSMRALAGGAWSPALRTTAAAELRALFLRRAQTASVRGVRAMLATRGEATGCGE